jgi:hypothetical protein
VYVKPVPNYCVHGHPPQESNLQHARSATVCGRGSGHQTRRTRGAAGLASVRRRGRCRTRGPGWSRCRSAAAGPLPSRPNFLRQRQCVVSGGFPLQQEPGPAPTRRYRRRLHPCL